MFEEVINALSEADPEFKALMDASKKFVRPNHQKIKYNLKGHQVHNLEIELDMRVLYSIVDSDIHHNNKNVILRFRECSYCGEPVIVSYDGENVIASVACNFPGGIKEVEFELDIPSGKMVFANDLRKWFAVQFDFNVNTHSGKLKTIMSYESIGMAHGFVGNSCPGVYKIDNRHLSISGGAPEIGEEVWNDEAQDDLPLSKEDADKIIPPGKLVGGICTDLWWYSVVDYNDFKRRFIDMGNSLTEFKSYIKDRCDVVKVDPGIYKFKHFFDADDWENHNKINIPNHYALISWSRDPEKIDYYAKYKKMDYTIGQCYLAAIAEYPPLYGFKEEELPNSLSMKERVEILYSFPIDRIEKSVAKFYSIIFCDFDRGAWHPSGWCSSYPVPLDTPDFTLPLLTIKHQWPDMDKKYCGLFLASTGEESDLGSKVFTLNESFLNSAYDMCYAILEFGSTARKSYPSMSAVFRKEEFRIKEEKNRQKITLDALKNLNERFPKTIPDRCLKFLKK